MLATGSGLGSEALPSCIWLVGVLARGLSVYVGSSTVLATGLGVIGVLARRVIGFVSQA